MEISWSSPTSTRGATAREAQNQPKKMTTTAGRTHLFMRKGAYRTLKTLYSVPSDPDPSAPPPAAPSPPSPEQEEAEEPPAAFLDALTQQRMS